MIRDQIQVPDPARRESGTRLRVPLTDKERQNWKSILQTGSQGHAHVHIVGEAWSRCKRQMPSMIRNQIQVQDPAAGMRGVRSLVPLTNKERTKLYPPPKALSAMPMSSSEPRAVSWRTTEPEKRKSEQKTTGFNMSESWMRLWPEADVMPCPVLNM